jgi:hypothetical protein
MGGRRVLTVGTDPSVAMHPHRSLTRRGDPPVQILLSMFQNLAIHRPESQACGEFDANGSAAMVYRSV